MSDPSDYERLVEEITAQSYEATITTLRAEVEKLKAERDEARLSWQDAADGWTLTGEGLSVAQHLIATLFAAIEHGDEEHRAWLKDKIDKHFSACNQGAYVSEITRLTSQLEQAERVIAPFVDENEAQVEERPASVKDSARPYMFYRATYADLAALSQWSKDRQAKPDGEAS